MMAKPMKTLELHHPMIQFLIIDVSLSTYSLAGYRGVKNRRAECDLSALDHAFSVRSSILWLSSVTDTRCVMSCF